MLSYAIIDKLQPQPFNKYMPKALTADKELAKSLWLQGLQPKTIGERMGVNPLTVLQWSYRYDWRGLKAKTQAALGKVDQGAISIELAEHSAAIRHKLASDLAQATSKLPKHSSKLQNFSKRQEGIGKLINNAAAVFGWRVDQMPNNEININVLTVSPDASARRLVDVSSPDSAPASAEPKESLSLEDQQTPNITPAPPSEPGD